MRSFNFEAAVCGGVPIIHALHTDFLADDVTSIMGIMNGTVSLSRDIVCITTFAVIIMGSRNYPYYCNQRYLYH